jgi:hypothetical protein
MLCLVGKSQAGQPVTIRLYPLHAEHVLPLLGDLVAFAVAYGFWLGAGLGDSGWALVPLALAAALAHVIQMALFMKVRFDDAGITIIRPWRRRRFGWARVAGLVITVRYTGQPGPDLVMLRLVLTGHEPPYGKYLTVSEKERYARGAPVVMRMDALRPEPGRRGYAGDRSAQCQERVLAELERRGLPRPEPEALAFRIRGQDPEEARRAIAADYLRRRDAARDSPYDAW